MTSFYLFECPFHCSGDFFVLGGVNKNCMVRLLLLEVRLNPRIVRPHSLLVRLNPRMVRSLTLIVRISMDMVRIHSFSVRLNFDIDRIFLLVVRLNAVMVQMSPAMMHTFLCFLF